MRLSLFEIETIVKLKNKYFNKNDKVYDPLDDSIPFIDVLHKLEKLDFLESAKEWINLRDKRNKIAHQYDDEPYEMTQAINNILTQKDIIKAIYFKIKQKAEASQI